MSFEDIIINEIERDFFTPCVKAEILFDMLLTPIIGEFVSYEIKDDDICFVTKEFPMLKQGIEDRDKSDYEYRTTNADYLLCGKNNLYLLELKTTASSKTPEEDTAYINYLERTDSGIQLGEEFCYLIAHIFNLEKTVESVLEKDLVNYQKASDKSKVINKCLNELFVNIAYNNRRKHYNEAFEKEYVVKGQEAYEQADDIKYAEIAKIVLKSMPNRKSEKYLFSLAQILEHNIAWDKDVKLIYLVPDGTPDTLTNTNSDNKKKESDKSAARFIFFSSLYEYCNNADEYKTIIHSLLEKCYPKEDLVKNGDI